MTSTIPEMSVNAYNTLWDWGAQMIIGTVTTAPCIAVAAEAYNDRMFMLTPSASSTDVIADKDNVYQICFTDPAQGSASAQYIAEHGLATKVAVIYNNADAYSTGIYQTFEAEAAESGPGGRLRGHLHQRDHRLLRAADRRRARPARSWCSCPSTTRPLR